MTAESQPAANAALPDASERSGAYEAWVRARHNLSADMLVIERPSPDAIAQIDAARRAGATKVVAGFLPDEIDWPEPGWSELLAWFVEHMDFVPRRLDANAQAPEARPQVLLVMDEFPDGESTGDGAEALANACAQATGWQLENLSIRGCDEVALAQAVTAAGLVINDVADWSFGFAIDELMARCRGRCVRRRNPGYSLLRYALLDQELPAETMHEVPRLRPPLLDAGWPKFEASGERREESWVAGISSGGFWQQIFSAESFQTFWRSWPGFNGPLPTHPAASRWMNRAVAWSALHAAVTTAAFPERARLRAGRMLAGWLAAEHKHMVGGRVSDAAIERWVLRHPDWVTQYERSAVGVRNAKRIVTGWVAWAIAANQPGARLVELMRIGRWALDRDDPALREGWLVVAWAENWSEVPRLLDEAVALSPAKQIRLREAFLLALAKNPTPEVVADRPGEVDHAIWTHADCWMRSLGPLGLRAMLLAALHARRIDGGRTAWRGLAKTVELTRRGGLMRIVRVVHAGRESLVSTVHDWFHTERPKPGALVTQLLHAWAEKRSWLVWCASRPAAVTREIGAAYRALRDLSAKHRLEPMSYLLLARLAAWNGCEAEAVAAIRRLEALRWRPAEFAASVALGFVLQGAESAARRLMTAWLEQPGDPASLLFVRALVWQLLGEATQTDRLLATLQREWPDHVAPGKLNDRQLVWAAVALKRCGRIDVADRLMQRAHALAGGSEELYRGIKLGTLPLAASWLDILGPGGKA